MLKSVEFMGVLLDGADDYVLKFENGDMEWRIALAPMGRFRPLEITLYRRWDRELPRTSIRHRCLPALGFIAQPHVERGMRLRGRPRQGDAQRLL